MTREKNHRENAHGGSPFVALSRGLLLRQLCVQVSSLVTQAFQMLAAVSTTNFIALVLGGVAFL